MHHIITTLSLAISIFVVSILSSNTVESNVIHLVSPADGNVCDGGNFTISSTHKLPTCSQNLPSQITWYLEGTEISLELNDYTCEINFTLTVINASSRDAGTYRSSHTQVLPSAIRNHSSAGVKISVQPCTKNTTHNAKTTISAKIWGSFARIGERLPLSDLLSSDTSHNCTAGYSFGLPFIVGFAVGGAVTLFAVLMWQKRKFIMGVPNYVRIRFFMWRKNIHVKHKFNGGKILFCPKSLCQRLNLKKLTDAGFEKGVHWESEGSNLMHADCAEGRRGSTDRSLKMACFEEVICNGRSSLFSGTMSSGYGKPYGIMVGHAAKRGSLCKTKHGKLIGNCVEALDAVVMTLNARNITIDIAFIEMMEFTVENAINIRGKRYRLTIAREQVKQCSEVFTVCRSGKIRNGIVRDVDTTVHGDPELEGVTTVTDFTGKSRISNAGDSGALLMSLSDMDGDSICVHGILIGHHEDIDREGNIVSMDFAVPLWNTMRAVFHLKKIAGLFAGDIEKLDFCRDVDKEFEMARCNSGEQSKTIRTGKVGSNRTQPEVDEELVVFSFGEAFAGVRQHVVKDIDIDHGLLQVLREKGLLTAFDLPDITSRSTMSLRAHRLLDILEEYGDPTKYELFTEALEATNQSHALDSIRVRPTRHAETVTRMLLPLAFKDELESALSDHVFGTFLNNLQTAGVLTNAQVVDCNLVSSNDSRVEPLFHILKRRPDKDFPWFCTALRKTIRWYLNEKILPRIDDTQYLISELVERRLLTVPERNELMSLLSRPPRLYDRLKHVLESFDESRIMSFCDAMIASGQQATQAHRAVELCKVLKSLTSELLDGRSPTDKKYPARAPLLCPNSGMRDLVSKFGQKAVFGVTFIDNHLYAVKRKADEVEVYETICFSLIRNLPVPGLQNPTDMDANKSRKCLYIIDRTNHGSYVFYTLPHRKSSGPQSHGWAVGAVASRLSVSSSGSVLTTCSTERIVKEFTWDGKLIRNIKLHADLANPQHAILLPTDQLIVTHCNRDFSNSIHIHRVCLVDTTDDAVPIRSYGGPLGSADNGRLSSPGHVAVTAEGFILVADLYNDRIAVFDSSLNHVLDIAAQRGSNSNDFHLVYTFCLDESRRSLCVAHNARAGKTRHITVYEMSRGTSFARLTSDTVS